MTIDAELREAGWRLARRRRHAVWHCGCGLHTAVLATSPSDWRASANARRDLRRCPASRQGAAATARPSTTPAPAAFRGSGARSGPRNGATA